MIVPMFERKNQFRLNKSLAPALILGANHAPDPGHEPPNDNSKFHDCWFRGEGERAGRFLRFFPLHSGVTPEETPLFGALYNRPICHGRTEAMPSHQSP